MLFRLAHGFTTIDCYVASWYTMILGHGYPFNFGVRHCICKIRTSCVDPRLSMKALWCIWLLCFWGCGRSLAQTSPIHLTAQTTSITVWQQAELLADPTHQLSLSTLMDTRVSSFSSTAGRSPQLGFSTDDYWLRFRIQTDGTVRNQVWVLHILYFFANRLTMGLKDETTGLIDERYSGSGTPMASWAMPYQEGAFRLVLLPRRTYTVLLRLSGNNSKSLTPQLSEIGHYQQFIQESAYKLALFFGMLIFAALLQLIFFGFTKERNFLYYAVYLLSLLFAVTQPANGLPGEVYFWPTNEWLLQNGMTLSSSICSFCLLIFYSNGLKIKTHTPWLIPVFRASILLMGSISIGILVGWLGVNVTQYVLSLGLIFLGLALFACIASLLKGFKPARYYLLATLSFLTGMIILFLWHWGLVPMNLLTSYSVPLGSLSEIALFTLALADDYQRTQRQERQVQLQLIDTLQTQNKQVTAALLQGQTLERKRVAADLHDNLGTTLSALHWNLEAMDVNKLTSVEQSVYATIREQVSQAYTDVRLLSHNLLPDELARQGLATALQRLIEKLNRNTALHFQLTGIDCLPRLDQQTEFELYSICLELLNNTIKHAHASEAYLIITIAKNLLYLTVSDNGTSTDKPTKEGRGLQNVAARVESLGGTWAVESGADRGTTNLITVPVTTPDHVSSQT
jgi:signal transduction histidine kinase